MKIRSFTFVAFMVFVTQAARAQTVDVTAAVRASISGGSLSVVANTNSLGVTDPSLGTVKKLKVEYTIDKVASQKVVLEDRLLSIQVPAGKTLAITKATYGDLPDKAVVDVTNALVSAVNNNALTIIADNSLGGDPAEGVIKELHVDYTVNGVAHKATATESNTLTLPLASDGTGKLVITKAEYGSF